MFITLENRAYVEELFSLDFYSIIVLDENGKILNARTDDKLGYNDEDLVGDNFSEIYTEESRKSKIPAQNLEKAAAQGNFRNKEEITKKDGTKIEAENIITPIKKEEDQIMGYIAITKHIDGEENDFNSVIYHEIQNTLVTAEGYLELYKESLNEDDLDTADKAIQRMREITENVKNSSKLQKTEKEDVELKEIFEEAYEYSAEENTTYNIEEMAVKANKIGLMRLFCNLITNSVEHNSHPIHIEVGPLENGFYYQDNGKGILEENSERIFQKGFTSSQGDGIGLYVIQNIIDRHGWEIQLRNPEKGARFEIYTNQ